MVCNFGKLFVRGHDDSRAIDGGGACIDVGAPTPARAGDLAGTLELVAELVALRMIVDRPCAGDRDCQNS